jgi:hypothetical protein
MKINLHIERLVLEGLEVDRRNAPQIQAAVETELTRLLTDGGLSTTFKAEAALVRVQANAIQLRKGNSTADLGQQIAQSIYGGIGNE